MRNPPCNNQSLLSLRSVFRLAFLFYLLLLNCRLIDKKEKQRIIVSYRRARELRLLRCPDC
jgi:hypothetical protein